MNEIWKSVYKFPEYEVSNLGRVRRISAARGAVIGRILRQRRNSGYRYYMVNLYNRGGMKSVYVHRLVARAFVGLCPLGKTVNHKDGKSLNNTASNLDYLTSTEQMQHASRLGLLAT